MADIVRPGESAGGPLNAGALPNNYDLAIYKGDFVELYVTVKDSNGVAINLTGYVPKAQIKTDYDAVSATGEFTCTLTGVTGQVKIYLSSTASATLPVGSYIWDFQLKRPDNDVRTYLTGDVTVYPEVTT
jgi:hypothetical protein